MCQHDMPRSFVIIVFIILSGNVCPVVTRSLAVDYAEPELNRRYSPSTIRSIVRSCSIFLKETESTKQRVMLFSGVFEVLWLLGRDKRHTGDVME